MSTSADPGSQEPSRAARAADRVRGSWRTARHQRHNARVYGTITPRTPRARIARWWTTRVRLRDAAIVIAATVAFLYAVTGPEPALWVLGGWALFETAMRRPGVVATVLVFAAYAVAVRAVAVLYAVSRSPYMDLRGALLVLLLLGVLVALISHYASLGRPWVTCLYAYGAVLLLGPILIVALGGIGYWAAYISAALVLVHRCGGTLWVKEHLIRRRTRGQSAPAATTTLLSTLGNDWVILSGVGAQRATDHATFPLEHVAVGPGGVFVLSSPEFAGPVVEDPREGLLVNGRSLALTMHTLLSAAHAVAAALQLPTDQVRAVLVLHHAQLRVDQARVEVSNLDLSTLGQVEVVSPTALTHVLDPGFEVLDHTSIETLVRRARLRLRRTTITEPSDPIDGQVLAAVLDLDGRRKELPVTVAAAGVGPGSPIVIRQNGTDWPMIALTGQQTDSAGQQVVYACTREEYAESVRDQQPVTPTAYLAKQVFLDHAKTQP